ncbi:MAG: acyl--CoA ligase, partial [Acidobacteriales bacterium]|nr:acyl--CoA ligase [Terriglobales bacterium]
MRPHEAAHQESGLSSVSTFYELFAAAAQRWPASVATEVQRPSGLESYSFAELRRMAEGVGAWLHQRYAADTRAAILAENHPRWVAAFLGTTAAGCIAVPLDTAFTAEQVRKLLLDSGSLLLFVDAKHTETAQQAITGLN